MGRVVGSSRVKELGQSFSNHDGTCLAIANATRTANSIKLFNIVNKNNE